jgi:hypothetical protein
MKDQNVKIDGIYDLRTLKSLLDLGIKEFSFDFSPRSMNFLQQHVFMEMLDQTFHSNFRGFLKYQNEADFVIRKMLDDLMMRWGDGHLLSKFFPLEFNDEKDRDFYDSFDWPYYWHYTNGSVFKELQNSRNFKGLILHYSLLEKMHSQGSLNSFIQSLIQLLYQNGASDNFEIILNGDWNMNWIQSLFDYLEIDLISFPINSAVEVCYRNVDLNKVKSGMGYFQNKLKEVSMHC